jgi:hypothetical protein
MDGIMRGISEAFIDQLNRGTLSFVLEVEKAYRQKIPGVFVELRNDYIDVYFLGHRALEIRERNGAYLYKVNSEFLKHEKSSIRSKQVDNGKSKEIIMKDFDPRNISEIFKNIIRFKQGKIAEAIVQELYIKDNRTFSSDFIILDSQVAIAGKFIDMLGIQLRAPNVYGLSLIELKCRNDSRIKEVIPLQLIPYIDMVFKRKADFVKTYQEIYNQKSKLHLIEKRKEIQIAEPESEKDICGILLLDGFNVRSEKYDSRGLLTQMQKSIEEIDMDKYNIWIILKSYVLNINRSIKTIKVNNDNKRILVNELLGY